MNATSKMTCARCGKKVNIDKLTWAHVYFPRGQYDLERKFDLVCPKCKQAYGDK